MIQPLGEPRREAPTCIRQRLFLTLSTTSRSEFADIAVAEFVAVMHYYSSGEVKPFFSLSFQAKSAWLVQEPNLFLERAKQDASLLPWLPHAAACLDCPETVPSPLDEEEKTLLSMLLHYFAWDVWTQDFSQARLSELGLPLELPSKAPVPVKRERSVAGAVEAEQAPVPVKRAGRSRCSRGREGTSASEARAIRSRCSPGRAGTSASEARAIRGRCRCTCQEAERLHGIPEQLP